MGKGRLRQTIQTPGRFIKVKNVLVLFMCVQITKNTEGVRSIVLPARPPFLRLIYRAPQKSHLVGETMRYNITG